MSGDVFDMTQLLSQFKYSLIVVAVLAVAEFPACARGEVFVLATGGEVHGELVNADESPRRQYVIRPYEGGQIALAADRVVDVIQQQAAEIAYDRIKSQHEDSVDGNWMLAEWCRKNQLTLPRKFHLERILQLDPEHSEARRLLGFERSDGEWQTRDEIMQSRGYVKHGGRWILPQAVKILQDRKVEQQISKEWYDRIGRYDGWLDSDKRARAEEHLLAIHSPHAVDALAKRLEAAKRERDRQIYAEALSNIGTATAVRALVKHTLEDPNEDFRYFCLDLLERSKPPIAVSSFAAALTSKDNRQVNRAAMGLAVMADKSVVGPLIESLITTHKFKIGKDSGGAMSMTFGGGGGNSGTGFGTGGGPKIITRDFRNEQVLAALTELTGKDFDYDVSAWKYWLASQKPAGPKLNSRRDD